MLLAPLTNTLNKKLISAVKSNDLVLVKRLLKGEAVNNDIDCSLRWSVFNNYLEVVKFLVRKGANIHAHNDEALRESSRLGHFEIVKFLVTQGANIHADDDYPLRGAAAEGHLEIVKFLVTHGASIHANNAHALRRSAVLGHLEIVKFLITQGANIHANDDEALKMSASNEHYDVWKVLSAFIQEEKLLVAASDSMLVLPAVASVALVAAVGSMVREHHSVESAPHTKQQSITKIKISKI